MELSKTYDGVELADISSKTKHMEHIQESNQSNIGSSMEDNPVYGEVGNRPGIDRSFEENLSYWEIRRSNEPDLTVMKRNPAYGKMFIRTERENVHPSTNLDRTNTRIRRASKTLRTTVFLALLASCLALAASIASISLLKRSTIASKNEIDLLKGEIQELREKLNQSRLEMNSLKQNINFTDTVEITTQLNIIRSSVNTLNAVQQSMATQLISQHTSIEALNTTSTQLDEQMSSLQSTADTLNTKINSPVNLYRNCYEETRVCRIDPTSGVFFTRECSTSALVTDIQGAYTQDIRCEYVSNGNYVEATSLHRSGNYVWCSCDVMNTLKGSPGHGAISNSLASFCTIRARRCPLSQVVFD